MTTRASAPDAAVSAIEVVHLGIGPQPANRGFAILDLGREDGMLTEPVADAGDGEALAGEEDAWAAALAAGPPAAAVNPDHDRQRPLALFGQIQIELLPLMPARHILQIAQYLDAVRQFWLCPRRRRCKGNQ